eukprot:SM000032S12019  [mRNA]  locus=s32:7026:9227:+ [translate_table: standard]
MAELLVVLVVQELAAALALGHFGPRGEPLELPDSAVPAAFKDWGVGVCDWQTQCPTLADTAGGGGRGPRLYARLVRLLPTVGCEADAATAYSAEERVAGLGSAAGALAFRPDGSYNTVWPGVGKLSESATQGSALKVVRRNEVDGDAWEVEHCLVGEELLPRLKTSVRARVRILQRLRGSRAAGALPMLVGLTVYRERWEGPFRNGESLGGCSTSGASFAELPRLQAAELAGRWLADCSVADPSEVAGEGKLGRQGAVAELRMAGQREEAMVLPEDDGSSEILLPKGMWSLLRGLVNGGFALDAGWLVESGQAIISTVAFDADNRLQGSSINTLSRA